MFGEIEAYADDLITKQIIAYGNHTRPEFAFATSVIDYGDHIFDIGAHIGTFTMQAQMRFGKAGRAICVEGFDETFAVLHRNLRHLGLSNCKAINAVIAESSSIAVEIAKNDASANDLNTGGFSVVASNNAKVSTATIDELVNRLFKPSYLKIDIEGYEAQVIIGSEFIRSRKPIMYFEVNAPALDRYGIGLAALDDYLRALGYLFFTNIGPRNERFDGFKIKAIDRIVEFKPFFDVLAVATGNRYVDLLQSIST